MRKTIFTILSFLMFATTIWAQKTITPIKPVHRSTAYFSGTVVVPAGETVFVAPGTIKPSTNELENRMLITRAGRIRTFWFSTGPTAYASITLRRNGIDTLLSTTWGGSLLIGQADLYEGVNVHPGDFITVAIFSFDGVTLNNLSIDLEQ